MDGDGWIESVHETIFYIIYTESTQIIRQYTLHYVTMMKIKIKRNNNKSSYEFRSERPLLGVIGSSAGIGRTRGGRQMRDALEELLEYSSATRVNLL